ncbi:hypothetical protein niasHT_000761 [Heterodera trifolii]|uniref:Uncharacterized protein n=1 Tax=Heterodera trifolii TaxID=157864 RepID=A0ABD2LNK3_9BILA
MGSDLRTNCGYGIRQCAQLHDATAEEKNFGQRRLSSPICIHNFGQIADQKWRGHSALRQSHDFGHFEQKQCNLAFGRDIQGSTKLWEQCFVVGASVNHRMCIGLWGLLLGKHRRYYEEVLNFLRRNDAGRNDAGRNDAGRNDAGRNDAGRNDAGLNDAGRNDAGRNDAGRNDAGRNDAGRNDAGRNDARRNDAGRNDGQR